MAKSSHTSLRRTLTHDQLSTGMTIHEITELSFAYTTLDSEMVRFLRANFQGASAVLIGDSGPMTIPIEDLKELDQLDAIVDIPNGLRIATVAPGLPESLYKRGFLKFMVSRAPNAGGSGEDTAGAALPVAPGIMVGSDEAIRQHQEKVIQVKTFLESVNPAVETRDETSHIIEDMMDRGRAGQFSSKGIEAAIEAITGQRLGQAMLAIAGLKSSDQTYTHCVDMSVILAGCYADILEHSGRKVDEAVARLLLVSGFMHDIGKSRLPKEILDSSEAFGPDSNERLMLHNHAYYGAEILKDMGMHRSAVNMAHYHHVKKDPSLWSSYPDVPYEIVPAMVRFASVVDVYQALIGRRSYKRNWVPGKAIQYILGLRGTEFDDAMVDQFVETMGRYPVISLVRLNTGELAYVLMVAPREHPDRPVVSIVENAKGEMLTHHELLDLMIEPDICVTDVVDHYDHYNKSEDQAFRIFQSISID